MRQMVGAPSSIGSLLGNVWPSANPLIPMYLRTKAYLVNIGWNSWHQDFLDRANALLVELNLQKPCVSTHVEVPSRQPSNHVHVTFVEPSVLVLSNSTNRTLLPSPIRLLRTSEKP